MQGWRTAVETNIQKMQVLLETVRAGSFTRAAERLSYSQSGVSRMVADLEADWGFKVLDRSREGVALSADGRQVMPAVEALCEEFVRLQRRVDEMRGLMRGKICIGTFSSVATHVLPPVIARFRADYPDIDYELLMGDYSEIEQWVAEGRCARRVDGGGADRFVACHGGVRLSCRFSQRAVYSAGTGYR